MWQQREEEMQEEVIGIGTHMNDSTILVHSS